MVLSEARSQVRQFLVARYHTTLTESASETPEEVVSINVLARDLEGETDWKLADSTKGSDFGTRATTRGGNGRHCEACLEINQPIPSSVLDLLTLAIRGVETMSGASILEVLVGALE